MNNSPLASNNDSDMELEYDTSSGAFNDDDEQACHALVYVDGDKFTRTVCLLRFVLLNLACAEISCVRRWRIVFAGKRIGTPPRGTTVSVAARMITNMGQSHIDTSSPTCIRL
jgi:hypothetical protein